jgi:hypothetical protein
MLLKGFARQYAFIKSLKIEVAEMQIDKDVNVVRERMERSTNRNLHPPCNCKMEQI